VTEYVSQKVRTDLFHNPRPSGGECLQGKKPVALTIGASKLRSLALSLLLSGELFFAVSTIAACG